MPRLSLLRLKKRRIAAADADSLKVRLRPYQESWIQTGGESMSGARFESLIFKAQSFPTPRFSFSQKIFRRRTRINARGLRWLRIGDPEIPRRSAVGLVDTNQIIIPPMAAKSPKSKSKSAAAKPAKKAAAAKKPAAKKAAKKK
jgi:hypothetical protein